MQATTQETVGRTLTELDHVRLEALLRRGAHPASLVVVNQLLDGADLLPSQQIGPDVVTMNSQLQLLDVKSGQRRTLTLCYPMDADAEAGLVSVFSPLGAALLGCRVGELARWQTPYGETLMTEILAILYQPEASGDFTR